MHTIVPDHNNAAGQWCHDHYTVCAFRNGYQHIGYHIDDAYAFRNIINVYSPPGAAGGDDMVVLQVSIFHQGGVGDQFRDGDNSIRRGVGELAIQSV